MLQAGNSSVAQCMPLKGGNKAPTLSLQHSAIETMIRPLFHANLTLSALRELPLFSFGKGFFLLLGDEVEVVIHVDVTLPSLITEHCNKVEFQFFLQNAPIQIVIPCQILEGAAVE